MKTRMVSVRMPDDMLRELEQLAKREDRPLAWIIRWMIEIGLKEAK